MNTVSQATELPIAYPFTALVGQRALKDALLWLAIDPSIGGVLVTGTRGTAKSTAVRALADLLPPIDLGVATPFVELPVGATEDRVIGTLDVRSLLTNAERRFEPGLLARAHRGILYVDEVNLLPDHLVDVILDAAATGINVVERDGASFTHAARIMLVGTMNPEEGELRPQLLDRFGLCVAVANDDDLERRVEILQRRIAFEEDPGAFTRAYEPEGRGLRARIARARALLPSVSVDGSCLRHAARLAIDAHVEGMRADLTIVRTARAIAAFEERTMVSQEEIERAAQAALAHRRREAPRGTPPPPRNRPQSSGPQPTGPPNQAGHDAEEKTFDIGAPAGVRLALQGFTQRKPGPPPRFTAHGEGTTREVPSGLVRVVATPTARIAALATIHAAARERASDAAGFPLAINIARHLRFIERRGRERRLVVFLIDASGSMAAAARMRAAKGAVCALLEDAYHRRDAVALIAFRAEDAEVLVPPTRSAALAYRRLATLATGGRTPLAQGLRRARELLAANALRDPTTGAYLVIVSDARANTPPRGAFDAALEQAAALRAPNLRVLCIDTESSRVRLGNAARLATALDATYQHLDDCTERMLGATVREWMAIA